MPAGATAATGQAVQSRSGCRGSLTTRNQEIFHPWGTHQPSAEVSCSRIVGNERPGIVDEQAEQQRHADSGRRKKRLRKPGVCAIPKKECRSERPPARSKRQPLWSIVQREQMADALLQRLRNHIPLSPAFIRIALRGDVLPKKTGRMLLCFESISTLRNEQYHRL